MGKIDDGEQTEDQRESDGQQNKDHPQDQASKNLKDENIPGNTEH
jgi:hypothetical protein